MTTLNNIGKSENDQYHLLGSATASLYEKLGNSEGQYNKPSLPSRPNPEHLNDGGFEYFSEHDLTVGKHEEEERGRGKTLIAWGLTITIGIGMVVLVYMVATGQWQLPFQFDLP